jgi:hypothetical protein
MRACRKVAAAFWAGCGASVREGCRETASPPKEILVSKLLDMSFLRREYMHVCYASGEHMHVCHALARGMKLVGLHAFLVTRGLVFLSLTRLDPAMYVLST